jgi:uncharacterized protein (DUF1697 family)
VTTYVVLLRGVNVGGHRKVPSADLKAAAADAGLHGARTYANSGNLVAEADDGGEAGDVAHALARALDDRLGLDVQLLAVPTERLERLVADLPFPEAAADDPARVQLHLGPRDVHADGVARLVEQHDGPERIAAAGGALYVHYVDGLGRTRLTGPQIDRACGTWTTGRNWRTVLRLLELAREGP